MSAVGVLLGPHPLEEEDDQGVATGERSASRLTFEHVHGGLFGVSESFGVLLVVFEPVVVGSPADVGRLGRVGDSAEFGVRLKEEVFFLLCDSCAGHTQGYIRQGSTWVERVNASTRHGLTRLTRSEWYR